LSFLPTEAKNGSENPPPGLWQRRSALLLILPLAVLLWALLPYPSLLQKSSEETYILSVEWAHLLEFAAVFYGLYLLPGLALLAWQAKDRSWRPSFSSQRLMMAFCLACTAHVMAVYLQKYLHLPYRPWVVLGCLAMAYGVLGILMRWMPFELLARKKEEIERPRLEDLLTTAVLTLALLLGWEMTLRARGSSLSLMGDGYPHLINYLGTFAEGPLPDGLPFYSTFILNIHPMGFHALLAGIKTLLPGLWHLDLLRYFSVLMIPIFLVCTMGFFRQLVKSRLVAALGAAVALFISGGGLSLNIPIAYFPWYWALAWCLACGVFTLLLKSQWRSPALGFWGGLLLGAGALMHPFFAIRMGAIVAFWIAIEGLRVFVGRPLGAFVKTTLALVVSGGVMVGLWMVPLLLRHGWEETYSYDFILQNFSTIAPEGVNYIRNFHDMHFRLVDLWTWSFGNAGIFPIAFAPLGLVAIWKRREEESSVMLCAWLAAMTTAILSGLLPNSYRYFEYFFFGLLAWSVYGLDWILAQFKGVNRMLFLTLALAIFAFSIRWDFLPKYRRTLELYGRTSLSQEDVEKAEARALHYLRSKAAGTLDRDYGAYTGYLWSRQKKLWDIYVQTQKAKRAQ